MTTQNFKVKNGLEVGGVLIADANGTINATATPDSGVAAGTVGNSTSIPVITVNAKGIVTDINTASVSGVSSFNYYSANDTFVLATGDGSNYTQTIPTANSTVNGLAGQDVATTATPTFPAITATNTSTNLIAFGVTGAPSHSEGQLFYDTTCAAIAYHNDEADITIPIAQREYVRIRNDSGNTITLGTPVYATGSYQNSIHLTVDIADASDSGKYEVIGLAGHDIENNSYGYVVVRGVVSDFDTSQLTVGQRVHLGFATPGSLVSAAPEYPNYPMDIGTCLDSNATTGKIYVNIIDHTFERARITGSGRVDGNFTVGGDLTVLGAENIISVNNLQVDSTFIYVGSGDTIPASNITFTGTGLNDMTFSGHYNGTTTQTYYVRINNTSGGSDTFDWSKDNFSSTEAANVTITGSDQSLESGLSISFNATTGHTANDKWEATAGPTNVDLGFAGNYSNTSLYSHTGFFRDASDGIYKFFGRYDPEPEGTIDTANNTFEYASVQVLDLISTRNVNIASNAVINSLRDSSGRELKIYNESGSIVWG